MTAAARVKRWLYLVHRWLGIALAVVMLAWFVSGMVMLYVGYPKLTAEERLAALPPLPAEGCCVPLAQAVAAAQAQRATLPAPAQGRRAAGGDDAWRLTSVAGRPRLIVGDEGRQPVAVDAVNGRVVAAAGRDEAEAAARHFAQGAPVRWLRQVDEDAWTHSRALDGHRPLHLLAVDEPQRRWLYVSSRTGEVVRDASFTERSWGWIGAWLHWLYLFRGGAADAWWADIVIALSLAGSLSALSGIVVGLWRWRFRGTYRSGRRTPYTDRAARWHHVAGMAGGLLAFTWVLSGLFSMNPWKVFDAPGPRPDRQAYAGAPADPARAPDPSRVLQALAAQGVAAREITWHRVGGSSFAQAHGAGLTRLFNGAQAEPLAALPPALWQGAAARLLPQARVVRQERLDRYDAWYYAREPHTMGGHRERPLPAWRLRFDDANDTWVVIDPRSGALLQISDGHRRVDRWLFAFLHSFDLPALLALRPGWDLWMLGFSLAGTLLAGTAVVTGARRLRRMRHHHGKGAGLHLRHADPGRTAAITTPTPQGETS
jgi:hypothetical protein